MKKTKEDVSEEAAAKEAIGQLQALIEKMPPGVRDRVAGLGMNVPYGDVDEALLGHYKFGIRCVSCNQVALFYVGDKWKEEDGNEVDYPPPWPHNRILWTQTRPPHEINRAQPTCQHCGVPVPLDGAGCFRRDRKQLVVIESWTASRDKSFDKATLREFRQEQAKGGAGQIEVSPNYNMPDKKASEAIVEQRGEQGKADIEQMAKIAGLDGIGRG